MLFTLDLLSTLGFACTGALLACRVKKGFFMVLLSALLPATGGGTIRELLLKSDSVFWVENSAYLVAVLLALPLAYLINRSPDLPLWFYRTIDTIGTTVFIMVGVLAAREVGCNLLYIPIMGLLTGIGGGILREAIVERQVSVIRDRKSILKPAIVALLGTFFVILELGELSSIATLAVIHFALGEYLRSPDRNSALFHVTQNAA